MCDLSPAICVYSYSAFLVTPWLWGMALYCHLFAPFTWVRVANSTRAQSRGTRTLVRRDTSDRMKPARGERGKLSQRILCCGQCGSCLQVASPGNDNNVLVRYFLLHRYFGFYGSRECRRFTVDLGTIVICIVDLGITKESKIELGVICDVSVPAVRLLSSPRNPLTLRYGSLLPFNLITCFLCVSIR